MDQAIRMAVVGLGKMGLSHLAMINAHPRVNVVATCDSVAYVQDVLNKYTSVPTFTRFDAMLREARLDAVIIATPSGLHAKMVGQALEAGLHVFCEKPFSLDPEDGEALVELAARKRRVNQVGYHNRFVGAFREVKRLLEAGAIGRVTHALAEAYGPVVLRQKPSSWRTRRVEGGGCLYDYAAHPLNLVNWYLGEPKGVGGTIVRRVFSTDTDDEVYGTLYFDDTCSAQISVNWSDESCRKMTTRISLWGTAGKITADRQECQAFLRDSSLIPEGYAQGWNVRYTTELTEPVWFYLRGEEYSAQLDYFVRCIDEDRCEENLNSFSSALATDRLIARMARDAQAGPVDDRADCQPATSARRRLFGRR